MRWGKGEVQRILNSFLVALTQGYMEVRVLAELLELCSLLRTKNSYVSGTCVKHISLVSHCYTYIRQPNRAAPNDRDIEHFW